MSYIYIKYLYYLGRRMNVKTQNAKNIWYQRGNNYTFKVIELYLSHTKVKVISKEYTFHCVFDDLMCILNYHLKTGVTSLLSHHQNRADPSSIDIKRRWYAKINKIKPHHQFARQKRSANVAICRI